MMSPSSSPSNAVFRAFPTDAPTSFASIFVKAPSQLGGAPLSSLRRKKGKSQWGWLTKKKSEHYSTLHYTGGTVPTQFKATQLVVALAVWAT